MRPNGSANRCTRAARHPHPAISGSPRRQTTYVLALKSPTARNAAACQPSATPCGSDRCYEQGRGVCLPLGVAAEAQALHLSIVRRSAYRVRKPVRQLLQPLVPSGISAKLFPLTPPAGKVPRTAFMSEEPGQVAHPGKKQAPRLPPGSPRQDKDGIACKTNALPHQTQGRATSPLIA